MKGVTKAARKASGLSRACGKCPFGSPCSMEMIKVCSSVFVEGFKKGVKWIEKKKYEKS